MDLNTKSLVGICVVEVIIIIIIIWYYKRKNNPTYYLKRKNSKKINEVDQTIEKEIKRNSKK